LLAQALQNDLRTIQGLLDPLPVRPEVADGELRKLFADLEARKARNTKTEVSPG
jgi:hypothetical protein